MSSSGKDQAMLRFAVFVLAAAISLSTNAADVPWIDDVQQPPSTHPHVDLPSLWGDHPARNLETWRARRREILAAWNTWLGPMPQRPQETSWTVLRTDTLEDITRQLIEYEGEPGLRVQAYLLRPRSTSTGRTRAGVVALHPTTDRTIEPIAGVEGDPDRHTGLQLARRGFVVICPRCFLWQDVDSYDSAVKAHRARHPQTLGMAKMLYDAQRALDILLAQPDVDPQRIGACGHSLGAKETLYLMAFDDRVRAGVACEGGIDFTSTNWDAPWYLGPDVRRADQPRNHHELVALIAPRAFLILGGEQGPGAADGDRSWPYLAAAMPIYRLFGDQAAVGLLNHREGHRLSPASFEKLAEWLEAYTSLISP